MKKKTTLKKAKETTPKKVIFNAEYDAGYVEGFQCGGQQMEKAKLGGITNLQTQLDAVRVELAKFKTLRRALINFLTAEELLP